MLSLPKDQIKDVSRSRSQMLPPKLHSIGLSSEIPKMNNYLFKFRVQKSIQAVLGPFLFIFNMFITFEEL